MLQIYAILCLDLSPCVSETLGLPSLGPPGPHLSLLTWNSQRLLAICTGLVCLYCFALGMRPELCSSCLIWVGFACAAVTFMMGPWTKRISWTQLDFWRLGLSPQQTQKLRELQGDTLNRMLWVNTGKAQQGIMGPANPRISSLAMSTQQLC